MMMWRREMLSAGEGGKLIARGKSAVAMTRRTFRSALGLPITRSRLAAHVRTATGLAQARSPQKPLLRRSAVR